MSDNDFFPPETVHRLREVDLRVLHGEHTKEETVVENNTVARLGGDEFVVLLEDIDPDEDLARNNADFV